MQMRQYIFTAMVTAISRLMLARDLLLGRVGPMAGRTRAKNRWFRQIAEAAESHIPIASGKNTLGACFVKPAAGPAQAAALICHGIGETVEHWLPVQRLFASKGVASLVFDYSGYGRSSGWVSGPQSEMDTVAAFNCLQTLMPDCPVALLGYSLGSGVAAAVIRRLNANRLILCAAFTSLRAAAQSLGFPRYLTLLLPDLWRAREHLHELKIPVLIVHGECDELFPVAMAEELSGYCASELVLVPGMTHNEPFHAPDMDYWGIVLAWLTVEKRQGIGIGK